VRNIIDMPCNAMAPDQYHGVLNHLINEVVAPHNNIHSERKKRGLPAAPTEYRTKIRDRLNDYTMSIDEFAAILTRYRPDAIQDNQELRILYLTEQISEADFKSALSRDAKSFHRRIEIGQVIQTVVLGMSDILTRLANFLRQIYNSQNEDKYCCDYDIILEMFAEIDALIEYANECLEFISKQYKLTRVALFVRDTTKGHHHGLFTAKMKEIEIDGTKQTVLNPVKRM